MKFHLNVSKAALGRWNARRCKIRAGDVHSLAPRYLSRASAAAQSRFDREIADHTGDRIADSAQDAVSAAPQTSAAVAAPADTDVLTSVPEAPIPEAAVPEPRYRALRFRVWKRPAW